METSKQCILLSTLNDQQSSITALDLLTGTNLCDYKNGGIASSSTISLISSEYLIAAEKDRPKVNIWHLNKRNAFHKKMITPGVVTSLTVTPCSNFLLCAIGTKVCIWQLTSGNLITILERHYQDISVLTCSADGFYFVTGADDGQCLLWSLPEVFSDYSNQVLHGASKGRNEPQFVWSDHQGKVTSAVCGRYGPFGKCITSSLDRTCKIYDVMTGCLLISVVFDTPIWSMATDLNEMILYSGGENGKIYETKLYKQTTDIVTQIASKDCVLTGHTDKVTSLSVSIDGACLISGSADCSIKKWHIPSKNCMLTSTFKAAITNCAIVNTPAGLIHHRARPDHFELLKREMLSNGDAYDDGSIVIRLPTQSTQSNASNSSSTINSLADDSNNIDKLKKELEDVRKVNHQLYSYSLNKIMDVL